MNADDISKELSKNKVLAKKSILGRIIQKFFTLIKYPQEGNYGIGYMTDSKIKNNAKVAGEFEENKNDQSQKIVNEIKLSNPSQNASIIKVFYKNKHSDSSEFSKKNQSPKLLAFTIAGNVSHADIDILKTALINTPDDKQEIRNKQKSSWAEKSLKFNINQLELSAKFNYQGHNKMTGENRNTNINEGNYNENIKGNYYAQHGNHGIGHMEGGKISGNATVAGKIVNNIKKPINIAIATLTAIVGTVGIIFSGEKNIINNKGGIIERGATVANKLTIYEGDPPEVRQRKLEQAKKLIAKEVFTNINNMDARLSYVASVLADDDDDFDERLRDIRNQVAPSLSQIFDSSHRQLIRQQEISSLRDAFASSSLSEVGEPLIQVLIDGNADPEKVRAFYNSLTEVKDVSESLFDELSAAAKQTSAEPKNIAYHEKRVELAVERLINISEIAHLSGLIVLDSLKIPLPNVQERLSDLQHLEPNRLISIDEATRLLVKEIEEKQRLLVQRATIVEEAKTLRDSALDEYLKLNEKLTIQPSDPWNIVVAKAISLRKLGRTSEAVAAFSRYSDMFAEQEPTAKQYSRTAQQFTIQLNNLRVEGGVYLYEVIKGGVADKAGLKVGDIIIGYSDKNITDMNEITKVLQKTPTDNHVRLTYLRMSNTGTFERQTITVKTGSLGVAMMPI